VELPSALRRFPRLSQARYTETILHPGEAL
jgi:hypothetical protein